MLCCVDRYQNSPKLKLFLQKKIQYFRALRTPLQTPAAECVRRLTPSPPDLQWPSLAKVRSQTPETTPHCRFLAMNLRQLLKELSPTFAQSQTSTQPNPTQKPGPTYNTADQLSTLQQVKKFFAFY